MLRVMRVLAVLASFGLMFNLAAAVQMPAIFTDGMVLQKSPATNIWGGEAAPGENLTITLGNVTATTSANAEGKWRVALNLTEVGAGPHILRIVGENPIEIKDVLVGQVWLCSGQSNMEFKLADTLGVAEELAAPASPLLRQFTVDKNASMNSSQVSSGRWNASSSATVGTFSGVAYYFGKKLGKNLDEPIGLINASWGGTPVEAWTDPSALLKHHRLRGDADRQISEFQGFPERQKAYSATLQSWLQKYHRQDSGSNDIEVFAKKEASVDSGWKLVTLPNRMKDVGLADAGVIWLRRTIEISSENAKRDITLVADGFHQFDTIYWNGRKVGETTLENYKGEGEGDLYKVIRSYRISKDLITPGPNILAIRLYSPLGDLGVAAGRFYLDLKSRVPLSGPWLAKEESRFPLLTDEVRREAPQSLAAAPRPWCVPGTLFNGMIRPLVPYTIQGVIWYQGESNVAKATEYQDAFSTLIGDWRNQWSNNYMPFYFCQLANFRSKQKEPSESKWAELREAQNLTLQIPNTGQAVLIDVGEAGDIHPRDKKTVGERLAAIALAKNYGHDIPYEGPCYREMKIEGDKIRLSFTQTNGGLVAKPLPPTYWLKTQPPESRSNVRNSPNSELEGFSIRNSDGAWFWADAVIDGDEILVGSPSVKNPVAVRYAWADNPTCNLYNKAGFPASPFRTDVPAFKQP